MRVITYADAYRELRFRNYLPFLLLAAYPIVGLLLTLVLGFLARGLFSPVMLLFLLAMAIGIVGAWIRRARFVCPCCGGYYLLADWGQIRLSARRCCHCGDELRLRRNSLEPVAYDRPRPRLPAAADALAARPVLTRVGVALIVIGLLDIGVMIYCILHGIGYSSSFNILAVVLGIFLLRGSLMAAQITVIGAIFFGVGFATGLLLAPFAIPIELVGAQFRHLPLIESLTIPALLGTLAWIVATLSSAPVRDAQDRAGIKRLRLIYPAAIGFALPASLIGLVHFMQSTDAARHAIELAQGQTGPGYAYFVNKLSIDHADGVTRYHGVVTAYGDTDTRQIPVDWSN